MWPFKKKEKLVNVNPIGAIVLIEGGLFVLVEECDELWLLPLYEFRCSQTMYRLDNPDIEKPSAPLMRAFGLPVDGDFLTLVDSEH